MYKSIHLIMFLCIFQHRKPGNLSPITALYLPFSPEIWLALIGVVVLSLCFTLIYSKYHPRSETSVYNLALITLASIFEESHMVSLSSLQSFTIRYNRAGLKMLSYPYLHVFHLKVVLCAGYYSRSSFDSIIQGSNDIIIVNNNPNSSIR